ncbi:hypothetical protein Vadar_018421 [Vaccinium darrowii]|uniref:Uncharacterized protein n=1 Tax=Vaccinium darrowii TaxID=229202 RepID=A0ACB7ZL08_9ERIC|nr:hypothetical protein Vadar_018421 [Vaccinium darrowii]
MFLMELSARHMTSEEDEEDGEEEEGEISTYVKSKKLNNRISDVPEGKKKKKKKTRLPMNVVDMQWKFSQDHLAADNYNMMPLGPSLYNPFWSGMQPGMEGYVALLSRKTFQEKLQILLLQLVIALRQTLIQNILQWIRMALVQGSIFNQKMKLLQVWLTLNSRVLKIGLLEACVNQNNIEGLTSLDVDGMDYCLGIVDDCQEICRGGSNFITNQTTNDYGIPLAAEDAGFLEFNDLNESLINIPTDVVDQLLSLLEEGDNGLGEHFDTSQVNCGGQDIVDLEYPLSSCDENFTQWEQQEEGELDDLGA